MPSRSTTIAIELDLCGWSFSVRVVPIPVGVSHDRKLRPDPEATSDAALLAHATGWPIADRIGGDSG